MWHMWMIVYLGSFHNLMNHFNVFPTPTRVEVPLGKFYDGPKVKIDCTNSYESLIGVMFNIA